MSQDTGMVMILTVTGFPDCRDADGTVRSELEAPKTSRFTRRACAALRNTRAAPESCPPTAWRSNPAVRLRAVMDLNQ